jgi:hypothetical protein
MAEGARLSLPDNIVRARILGAVPQMGIRTGRFRRQLNYLGRERLDAELIEFLRRGDIELTSGMVWRGCGIPPADPLCRLPEECGPSMGPASAQRVCERCGLERALLCFEFDSRMPDGYGRVCRYCGGGIKPRMERRAEQQEGIAGARLLLTEGEWMQMEERTERAEAHG